MTQSVPPEENPRGSMQLLITGCQGFLFGLRKGIPTGLAVMFTGVGICFTLMIFMIFFPSYNWPGNIFDLIAKNIHWVVFVIVLGSAIRGAYTNLA